MTDIYLRSVEFSNFRVYGDSYAYELSPGPGVTLITGGNGLGKTSFFDGVEWALTGKIGRFSDIPYDGRRKGKDHLTRIGAPENSHRVSLQFSEGLPIDRGAGFDPDIAEIIQLLKRPEWAEIADLQGYLSITHFFGQASAQRFSLKKPNEQWEALKGPAGIDRINVLHDRMSSIGVRRAFTRAIDERTKRLTAASDALVAWDKLLHERDRAQQLASSENAVDPSHMRRSAENLANESISICPAIVWTSIDESESPESMLERLSALLREVNDQNEKDLLKSNFLGQLVAKFDAATADASAVASQLELGKQRHKGARDNLEVANSNLIEATSILSSCEARERQVVNRMVGLDRVSAASNQFADVQARKLAAENELRLALAATTVTESHIDRLREQLASAIARRAERRALADQVGKTRKLVQISNALADLQIELDRVTQILSSKSTDELSTKRSKLDADRLAVQEKIQVYMSELRRHDDRIQAIKEAVSLIAHRLTHDDSCCPVCATEFSSGRLVELAREQAELRTTPATQLAEALSKAQIEFENLTRELIQVDIELSAILQLEASRQEIHDRKISFRQQLVDEGGAADITYDDSSVDEVAKELDLLDEQIMQVASPEDLKIQIEAAEIELEAEAAKRSSLYQQIATANEALHSARSILLQSPELWNAEQGFLVDLTYERIALEGQLKEIGAQIDVTKKNVAAAQAAYSSLAEVHARESESLASLSTRQVALSKIRQEHIRQWNEAGHSQEPSESVVATLRAHLIDNSVRLETLGESLRRLVTGYRTWIGNEQLRKLRDEIAMKLGIESIQSEDQMRTLLIRRVEKAREDINIAQNAKLRVDLVRGNIQQLASTYADDVLVPLNSTIKSFARTLMTWSDESISYQAEHTATRSELRPGIVKRAADGSVVQMAMNPNLYFSEGQLSALSVAALFAASTTFGWSRWKGLLLDDPLQHNDVIHASAFMDLLRQLVNGLGYQIILSTHDSSEAEFLSRKCRSSNIPYQVHELAPRGENGLVDTRERLSNIRLG